MFTYGMAFPAGELLINEAAPNGTSNFSDNDWVEIYVKVGGDYSGRTFYVNVDKKITFPTPLTLAASDYIIIHEETGIDEYDGNGGKGLNANGYWDLYGMGEVSGTSDIIFSVRNFDGTQWYDALAYSNKDHKVTTSTIQGIYDSMKQNAMWADGPGSFTNAEEIEVSFSTVSPSGSTIARSSTSFDANSKSDWALTSSPTPGLKNVLSGGAAPPVGGGNIQVLITEVAPGISGGDFVEMFVTANSNLNGAKIYEGATLIKTLGDISAQKDQYVILHASVKGIDETGAALAAADTNTNGSWDVYSDESSPGLTGTDNCITLRDSAGNITDFISYANDDTSFSAGTYYNNATSVGQWTPPASNEAEYILGSVSWSGSSKGSVARKLSGSIPMDTNSKNDWFEQSVANSGKGYGNVFITTVKLAVAQSPFSPYGDGKFTEAQIAYKIEAGYSLTIRIFDMRGRLVKTLVDKADSSPTGDSQMVPWNGMDDNGNIAPVGIYIVNITALNKATGKSMSDTSKVILGKRLK